MIIALLEYLLGKPPAKGEAEAGPEQKAPLDILEEAYARGEIGRNEPPRKRQDLLISRGLFVFFFRSLSNFI